MDYDCGLSAQNKQYKNKASIQTDISTNTEHVIPFHHEENNKKNVLHILVDITTNDT